jgi:hypothetical protein
LRNLELTTGLADHNYKTLTYNENRAARGKGMADSTIQLSEHPIIITLQDAISGKGFLSRITVSGRALMRHEGGKWWMYGVSPSGVAATGANVDEAFLRFRTRYKEILLDIAEETQTFSDFKQEVERFFHEPDADDEDARLWDAALKAIRSCSNPPPEPFANLKRKTPEDNPVSIKVERVDANASPRRFAPSDNVVDAVAKAA